jgi:ABC-2 type transport system permease protein
MRGPQRARRARPGAVLAAEIDKLRTLPLAVLAVLGTGLGGGLIAAVLAAAAADQDQPVSAIGVALRTTPFVVAGLVLVGVLPVTHEHTGRQVLTSLAAVPTRRPIRRRHPPGGARCWGRRRT